MWVRLVRVLSMKALVRREHRLAFVLFAAQPLLAGCGSLDFSLKDQEWFSRPAIFSRSLTLETPPLSDSRPVQAADLISAEGYCAGMAAPADANALTESAPGGPEAVQGGTGIAIGRTECEVARAAGAPDNVAISAEGGRRVTTLTYVRGPRPGIYRFADGRMTSMERGAEPEPPPRNTKGQRRRQS
jgi:hypothetical protein